MPPRRRSSKSAAPALMGVHATLADLVVPIDDVRPAERNPRRGRVEDVAKSLSKNGQYRPIVVRAQTKEILAGNHTWQAAKNLGWTEIAVTWVDVTDEAAERIKLADNRLSDLAEYDNDTLLEILRELPDLEGTGYDDAALAKLVEEIEGPLAGGDAPTDTLPSMWGVIIECDSEAQQAKLLAQLEAEGLTVRAMVL